MATQDTPSKNSQGAEERRRSRTATAYGEIADRLSDLRYPPGHRFTEAEVAKELNMSKTPVREALLMLSVQELVMPRPGAGYVVVPITLRDVRLLFAHWRSLADQAISTVAKNSIDSTLSVHLLDAVEDEDAFDSNQSLFAALIFLTDDRFLIREHSVLSIEIRRLLKLVLKENEPALRAHLVDIVNAVGVGAEDTAASLVRTHINDLEQAVITALLSGDFLQGASLTAPVNGT